MVPHRVVHAQPHESAKQQDLIDLLHQLPLRAHRVEHLQQQRPQHILGSDRGPPRLGVQRIELRAQRAQHVIRDLPHGTQRMIRRHPLLNRKRDALAVLTV